ncbi:uncharacterized protein LOC143569513 [Bidens hawaiensis]|uniref:uncharacterized protein LOC143569513 n=1 Tax=Bidens hawaiensis TaxID=980011 RepID=UPI004049E898
MMISLGTQSLVFSSTIALFVICVPNCVTLEDGLKSMVYLSPKITQPPGSVSKKFYYDMEFPKGHIALKSFNAEVVDEAGSPVSLQDTYLHHWIALRYYEKQSDFIFAGNAGICDHLPQFFGLGSETRKTFTHVPDPYGIEVGNPLLVPAGYEEKWMFDIHAIDTQGAVDAKGCTECRCDLFNVTEDEYGAPLNPNYVGGVNCCYNGTQCKVKDGVESVERNIYLKYTVKWVDWSDFIVPVQIIILDVTDNWQYTGIHDCLIEYDIEKSTSGVATKEFTNTIGGMMYGEIGSARYDEVYINWKFGFY